MSRLNEPVKPIERSGNLAIERFGDAPNLMFLIPVHLSVIGCFAPLPFAFFFALP